MIRRSCVSVIAILSLIAVSIAGGEPASDPVLEGGLEHTQMSRVLVEQAIASTNLVIKSSGLRLTLYNRGGTSNTADIPIYLVKTPPTARATPAVVPKRCRCIFVNPYELNNFIEEQSTGSGRLSLNAKYILTFILLHEVGHLVKSTSDAEYQNGELSELNIEPSRAKADEEDADAFAADLIRMLMQRKSISTETLEATMVATELSKLSWNMQAYRSLDEFGALAVGKPAVFFDRNLSHPNLHWRVLRTNHLIQNTSETKNLLNTFEDARQRGANPQPLYVAPKKPTSDQADAHVNDVQAGKI